MTLDAGGTNFAFTAVQNGETIMETFSVPSQGDKLQASLDAIVAGFEKIQTDLGTKADAISFSFPGPADYENGVIGDLNNLPGYRGGVALGPMLKRHFGVPVLINNDADLFTLGESNFGFIPHYFGRNKIHSLNLIGVTLGTGFGSGLTHNGKIITGNTNTGPEAWLLPNMLNPRINIEEVLSKRGIMRLFAEAANIKKEEDIPEPMEISEIANDTNNPLSEAAKEAYIKFGEAMGYTLAMLITIFDGHVAIGGGIARAWELYAPSMFSILRGRYETTPIRVTQQVYDAKNNQELKAFRNNSMQEVCIPGTKVSVPYQKDKRILIGRSILGTNKAVALGAYTIALDALKK